MDVYSSTVSLLMYLSVSEAVITVNKFVHQKDMSEYCRRRVMPSVFLGRHVMDAYSQILHFSQLEVPYSCFISVRTESGSDIILVMHMDSGGKKPNCSKEDDQLAVYEMAETFGGYWGPIPENILQRNETTPPTYYTLKYVPQHVPQKDNISSGEYEYYYYEDKEETTTTGSSRSSSEEGDFVRVEVPLVNVVGRMVDSGGQEQPARIFNSDDQFDVIYNVTPIAGGQYHTDVVPLMQFSVKKLLEPVQPRRSEDTRPGAGDKPRYQLDFNDFTPDPRLFELLGDVSERKSHTSKIHNFNRLLRFKNKKKGKPQFFAAQTTPHLKQSPSKNESFDMFTRRFVDLSSRDTTTESFHEFNMRRAFSRIVEKEGYKNLPSLFHKITTRKHNFSVNMAAKLSQHNNFPTSMSTKRRTVTFNKIIKKPLSVALLGPQRSQDPVTVSTEKAETTPDGRTKQWNTYYHRTHYTHEAGFIGQVNLVEDNSVFTKTVQKNESMTTESVTQHTSSNKLSYAPNLKEHNTHGHDGTAVKSTKVDLLTSTTTSNRANNTSREMKRKKRYIQVIPIDNAKPHTLTTEMNMVTESIFLYRVGDTQDFAQLVELDDDEIHSRLALRYLRRHVGRMVFSICNDVTSDTNTKHVFLFNSSRIVIAINNFTLKRMTIVATPARTLTKKESICPQNYIECQVKGARVCIDNMTACDGVPNCGANDIYDEDRLSCGLITMSQKSVYIAASTFLAFLLTMLYTVYYWLKRCVPEVSQAFFIYKDGIENVLFLDSVMRAPGDTGDDSKLAYPSPFYDAFELGFYENKTKNTTMSKLKRFLTFGLFKKRQPSTDRNSRMVGSNSNAQNNLYPFTETGCKHSLECEDKSVQTGSSLEMKVIEEIKERKQVAHENTIKQETEQGSQKNNRPLSVELQTTVGQRIREGEELPHLKTSELSLMKFFKDNKSVAGGEGLAVSHKDASVGHETELKSTMYSDDSSAEMTKDRESFALYDADPIDVQPGRLDSSRKRLRFDETLTTISAEEGPEKQTAKKVFLTPATKSYNVDEEGEAIQEHDSGRDFKRFWGVGKGKKTKKKMQNH